MTKDMPCQHVLYQSYLCYSSIIKIRLVFVSIYNSQYQPPEKKDFIPSDLLSGIKLSQLNTKSLIEAPLWRAGRSGSRAVPLYKSLSADAEPVCSERLLFMKLHHAMSPA